MKKQLNICLLLYMIMNVVSLQASCFQIAIPQYLVKKKATLLLLLSDSKGQQSFGKYRLQETKTTMITQKELEITTSDYENNDANLEILSNESNSFEESAML